MQRVVKTLKAENGELFALIDSRRIRLARCEAEVRLYTREVEVPVLGRGRVITQREAVLLVTFEHKPECPTDEDFICSIARIEFQGEILQTDGSVERLVFDNCILDGELDLTEAGTCRFELRCTPHMIRRLMVM